MPQDARREKGLYWDKAWSLTEGCSYVDAACANCWAAALASRWKKGGTRLFLDEDGKWNGRVLFRQDRLPVPGKYKSKGYVFSVWNDLFHESVSVLYQAKTLYNAVSFPQHAFLFCTKRPERIRLGISEYINLYAGSTARSWPSGASRLWFGTTVQDSSAAAQRRLWDLCRPGLVLPHRFLSVEPMLGPVSLSSLGSQVSLLDLVIVGCESGSKRRKSDDIWLKDLIAQCSCYRIPLFVKQWNKDNKVIKLPYGMDHKFSQLPF